jgi:hypothetical protein
METLNRPNEKAIKFVLNGRTFDTAISTTLAISHGHVGHPHWQFDETHNYHKAQTVRYEHVLYRTAAGAFFVHEHDTVKFEKGKPLIVDSAKELKPDEVADWIETEGAAIVNDDGLALPPQA